MQLLPIRMQGKWEAIWDKMQTAMHCLAHITVVFHAKSSKCWTMARKLLSYLRQQKEFGNSKTLIYDFMENKSLSKHLTWDLAKCHLPTKRIYINLHFFPFLFQVSLLIQWPSLSYIYINLRFFPFRFQVSLLIQWPSLSCIYINLHFFPFLFQVSLLIH